MVLSLGGVNGTEQTSVSAREDLQMKFAATTANANMSYGLHV